MTVPASYGGERKITVSEDLGYSSAKEGTVGAKIQEHGLLALRNIAKKWTMPLHDWKAALNRFAIVYENRLPVE